MILFHGSVSSACPWCSRHTAPRTHELHSIAVRQGPGWIAFRSEYGTGHCRPYPDVAGDLMLFPIADGQPSISAKWHRPKRATISATLLGRREHGGRRYD